MTGSSYRLATGLTIVTLLLWGSLVQGQLSDPAAVAATHKERSNKFLQRSAHKDAALEATDPEE